MEQIWKLVEKVQERAQNESDANWKRVGLEPRSLEFIVSGTMDYTRITWKGAAEDWTILHKGGTVTGISHESPLGESSYDAEFNYLGSEPSLWSRY